MRKLKFHEKKLLKKVDFLSWKNEGNLREIKILRMYHIQRREDYTMYNKIAGQIKKLTFRLKQLDPQDPFRIQMTDQLLEKLYNMGLIPTKKSLVQTENLAASSFCRRRLPVMMVRLKFSQTLKEAITFIEQGQIRVGPEIITDPAFLVTRTMEDFIKWADRSKVKRQIMKYNDKLDDFDLM